MAEKKKKKNSERREEESIDYIVFSPRVGRKIWRLFRWREWRRCAALDFVEVANNWPTADTIRCDLASLSRCLSFVYDSPCMRIRVSISINFLTNANGIESFLPLFLSFGKWKLKIDLKMVSQEFVSRLIYRSISLIVTILINVHE